MPSCTTLVWVAAFLAFASAAPTPAKNIPTGFKVNQVEIKTPFKSGAQAVADAHSKYGVKIPTHIQEAAAIATGSVNAPPSDQYDSSYICPVTIGGQTFHLDFDTGSSDLWVFSKELPANEQGSHALYDPAKSTTASKVQGATWKISYGDGSTAGGDVYTDTVDIGGTTITKQAVEPAASVSAQFVNSVGVDGLVGLAFPNINTVKPTSQNTFFGNAASQLPQPVFTTNLQYHAAGTYDFGYIDDSQHTGPIVYSPIDSARGFWTFSSTVAGQSLQGIADTGTTLLLLPDAVVSSYYSSVSGAVNDAQAGGYTFPCATTLPDFPVTVAGTDFVVPGYVMNYAPLSQGSATCFGGLQSSTSIGVNIFGDIFLKAVFVVFDQSTPQIGFATKPLASSPSNSTASVNRMARRAADPYTIRC